MENEEGKTIDTDEIRQEGGIFCLGGTSVAELNVTYNYGKHFPFGKLDGMPAKVAVDFIRAATERLGDDTMDNYWESTEGNVKVALKTLLAFAEYAVSKNIEAKFRVS